jgi:hypothetical protein
MQPRTVALVGITLYPLLFARTLEGEAEDNCGHAARICSVPGSSPSS